MKLFDLMQEKNYGTRSLAKEAGVSTATINWLINGKNGGPFYAAPDTRRKICEALKVKDASNVDEFAAAIEHYKRRYRQKEKARLDQALENFMLVGLAGD